jgi:tripartite-type tricarboxylate transporter receptor subunit TctC
MNVYYSASAMYHKLSRLLNLLAGACLSMGLFASSAHAQTFPNKPVKLVVPVPPGGGTDFLARLYAQKLGEIWKTPVIVENRPGADTIIASELVAKAKPDGYTLLVVVPSFVINPALRTSMPYDVEKSFAPVAMLASSPFVIIASNKAPARNLSELIALAKSRPGTLALATSEQSTRLAAESFKSMAGVDMLDVPYKGSSQLISDLAGNQIESGFSSLASSVQPHKQGLMRVLGVSTRNRSPLLPDVPAIGETVPGYDISVWYGVVAPAGTPPAVISTIQKSMAEVSAQPDVKERLRDSGAESTTMSPDEFKAFLGSELKRYAETAKSAGIKPN